MSRSVLIALAIALVSVAWILSGQLGAEEEPTAIAAVEAAPAAAAPTEVRVATLTAQAMTDTVSLNAVTEAERRVEVKAETTGTVEEVLVERGARVEAGQPLVRLADDARTAQLAEARALLELRRTEQRAASALNTRGYSTDIRASEAQAALESAEASVRRIEVELERLTIRAPFAGIVEERAAELGSFHDIGTPVATIVDLSPMKVVGMVSERAIGRIEAGKQAEVRLVGGRTLTGPVTFIGRVSEAATRTFRVEVSIANPDLALAAGTTAFLTIPTETVNAHFVSPAVLALADDGTIGVKLVDEGDVVRFLPVELLKTTAEGVWLGGLPALARVITVGHEFVVAGEPVIPVEALTQTAGRAG